MDDAALIKRIKEGDQKVMTEIYRLYRDEFIIWIGKKLSINAEDARDIFQNVLIVLIDNIKNEKLTELSSTLKTYLFGVGKNKAFEWLRKKPKTLNDPPSFILEHVVDTSGIEEKEKYEKRIALIYQALRKLGDPCKTLLELFYLQQMSLDDLAALLGYRNRDSVKTQRYKCMARLRKIIGPDFENL